MKPNPRIESRRIFKACLIMGLVLAVSVVLLVTVYVPWQRTWGATEEEVSRAMPGDEIVRNPTFDATRAVTIGGRPPEIWPWIVQIGYLKAGFYSYDRLDNDGIPSAERIIPEYQDLRVGDSIPLSGRVDAEVRLLEPDRFMLLVTNGEHDPWTWAWGLYPQDDGRTRLVTRLRARLDSRVENVMVNTVEIVMMRKHMLGIKRRVESYADSVRAEPGHESDTRLLCCISHCRFVL